MAEFTNGSAERTAWIRDPSDALRLGVCANGKIVITSGVHERRVAFLAETARAVTEFDTFTPDNDPQAEYDCGAHEVDGEKLFFKIDYYDKDLQWHSPDAADPDVTVRVLTIMLAIEYSKRPILDRGWGPLCVFPALSVVRRRSVWRSESRRG